MSSQTPSHLPVLDVVLNTFMAQALRVVVQREIPDLLAEQPRTVPELGQQGAEVGGRLPDALSGPPSGLISAALDVIGQQDDTRWCPPVHELFSRVDPAWQRVMRRIYASPA